MEYSSSGIRPAPSGPLQATAGNWLSFVFGMAPGDEIVIAPREGLNAVDIAEALEEIGYWRQGRLFSLLEYEDRIVILKRMTLDAYLGR